MFVSLKEVTFIPNIVPTQKNFLGLLLQMAMILVLQLTHLAVRRSRICVLG